MGNVRAEPLQPRVLLALVFGPDPTFGESGHVALSGSDLLVPLPSGKVFAAGRSLDDDASPKLEKIVRLNSDGSVDRSFGVNGSIELAPFRGAVYAGSRIFAVAEGDSNVDFIHAYTINGKVDSLFPGGGVAPIPTSPPLGPKEYGLGHVISATEDGGVLIGVNIFKRPYLQTIRSEVVKIQADGSVDTSFASNGFFTPPVGNVHLTSNGLLIHHFGTDGEGDELQRYSLDGKTVDTSFGAGGAVAVSGLITLREQPDGKLAYITQETKGVFLHRLNVNGSVDASFGENGSVEIPLQFYSFIELEIDPEGRIVIGASGTLFRFLPDGQLDAYPFDGSIPTEDINTGAPAVGFDGQGRILTADHETITRLSEHEEAGPPPEHVLVFNGTVGDDTIIIAPAAENMFDVTRNGVLTEFDAAGVTGFRLPLLEGDDSVTVTVDLPTTVTAGRGNDTITTAGAADSIDGGGGEDVIDCGDGADVLEFGDFDETGHLTITGGDGDKMISLFNGGPTDITLGIGNSDVNFGIANAKHTATIAGGNNDVHTSGGENIITIGGAGENHLFIGSSSTADVTTGDGTDSFEIFGGGVIHSGGGNDKFFAQSGNDVGPITIFAGAGDDRFTTLGDTYPVAITAHGEGGNDFFRAGVGSQSFYGDAGNDTLHGGADSDLLSGGGGSDRLFGEIGKDRLYGGAARDRLYGGGGDDRIFGNAGGDFLYAQHGNDVMFGGGGSDRLYAGFGFPVTAHGNAGDDFLIAFDNVAQTLFGEAGTDSAFADDIDELIGVE